MSLTEREKVFLEIHVQNLTSEPLSFERMHLDCVDGWEAEDINIWTPGAIKEEDSSSITSVFSGPTAIMQPQDIRQYLFILSPKPETIPSFPVIHQPGSNIPLGRLDISWRTGRLLTSVCTSWVSFIRGQGANSHQSGTISKNPLTSNSTSSASHPATSPTGHPTPKSRSTTTSRLARVPSSKPATTPTSITYTRHTESATHTKARCRSRPCRPKHPARRHHRRATLQDRFQINGFSSLTFDIMASPRSYNTRPSEPPTRSSPTYCYPACRPSSSSRHFPISRQRTERHHDARTCSPTSTAATTARTLRSPEIILQHQSSEAIGLDGLGRRGIRDQRNHYHSNPRAVSDFYEP